MDSTIGTIIQASVLCVYKICFPRPSHISANRAVFIVFNENNYPDIFIGTELWLSPAVLSEIFATKYQVFRKDGMDG